MTSKVTRSALVALTVVGAGAMTASPAFASIPTFYVQQPAVKSVKHVTPESAVLIGAVDTGGNPPTTFTLAAGQSMEWANSLVITNSGTKTATEYVDGLPASGSNDMVPLSSSSSFSNAGSDNYSQVVMEYDPLKDFRANGNNPGPETGFAPEIDVPTAAGLSAVSAKIGAYPAASGFVGGVEPLKPGTKYVYWITQQAGSTTAAQSYNTYNGSSVTTNPTWSCMPTAYAAVTSPYKTYSSSGTITGGGTTEPQIQGPCIYQYGGSANYYTSNYKTFTTPKLGYVAFQRAAMVSGGTASLKAIDHSVEAARGTLVLEVRKHNKLVSVAHGRFKVPAHGHKMIKLRLTKAGTAALAKTSPLTTKVAYTSRTDQPTHTHRITLK